MTNWWKQFKSKAKKLRGKVNSNILQRKYFQANTDYLLTECEVCRGKYLPEVLVQTKRRRREVCAKKPEGKYFPVQTERTRLMRNLLYGLWFLAFVAFNKLFISWVSSFGLLACFYLLFFVFYSLLVFTITCFYLLLVSLYQCIYSRTTLSRTLQGNQKLFEITRVQYIEGAIICQILIKSMSQVRFRQVYRPREIHGRPKKWMVIIKLLGVTEKSSLKSCCIGGPLV